MKNELKAVTEVDSSITADVTSVSQPCTKPSVSCRFYTLPLKKMEGGGWVWDSANNFVFQFESEFTKEGNYADGCLELQHKIIQSLNSDLHCPIEELDLKVKNNIEIFNGDKILILIRGWGGLTGTGKHNFSSEKACQIQDDFVKWLIYKLSKLEAGCVNGS